ncbi:MBL fold metallo-hydrolase [Corynebacterium camporealensis]|uniref:MBL fold metallo-hydrolase n=1 Tax=Corynebacterium camporealensis TaxID=161896 RepID=UPI000CF9449E|nr:MBL fold metallo-hydrolase [Corynebacterium camporealensis]
MGIASTFYGTSSVHITDGISDIFVDAFLSRPSVKELALGKLTPNDEAIDWALRRGGVEKLDALFVAHSHHDHLMDAPRVVSRLGGVMYGSRSSLNYGRGEGLEESAMSEIAGGSVVQVGDFTVSVIEAPHSPGNIAPGVIKRAIASPCHALEFKDGGCFVFHVAHPQAPSWFCPARITVLVFLTACVRTWSTSALVHSDGNLSTSDRPTGPTPWPRYVRSW